MRQVWGSILLSLSRRLRIGMVFRSVRYGLIGRDVVGESNCSRNASSSSWGLNAEKPGMGVEPTNSGSAGKYENLCVS